MGTAESLELLPLSKLGEGKSVTRRKRKKAPSRFFGRVPIIGIYSPSMAAASWSSGIRAAGVMPGS